MRNSMFKLCATGRVDVQKRNFKSTTKLDVVQGYPLEGKMFVTMIFGELRYVSKRSGFLTVGGDCNWSRRWVVLDGTVLKYWNYPNDEEFVMPISVVDLKTSKTSTIKLADRSKCPRPRTFILEFADSGEKFYFSADSCNDLHKWTSALKEVIAGLKGWNI